MGSAGGIYEHLISPDAEHNLPPQLVDDMIRIATDRFDYTRLNALALLHGIFHKAHDTEVIDPCERAGCDYWANTRVHGELLCGFHALETMGGG